MGSRQNEYRKRNLAKCAAYMREWRKRRRDHCRAWVKANREKNPERHREANRRWRESEKGRSWKVKWADENRDLVRESNRRAEFRRRIRMMTSAEYYARRRALQRMAKARVSIVLGRTYRPVFHRRIPDWACLGETVMDYGSRFLVENMTVEQRAFVREMYREKYGK